MVNAIFLSVNNRWSGPKIRSRVIVGALGTGILLSLQWPLAYTVRPCIDLFTDRTYYHVIEKDSSFWRSYYRSLDYGSMALFNVLPVALLLVLNCAILRTLRRVIRVDARRSSAVAEMKGLAATEPRERSRWGGNAVLFAVVGLFLVCLGPQVPARVLFELHGPHSRLVLAYMSGSQILLFLNASLNFCLYCLVSRRYRGLMRRTLRNLLKKPTTNGQLRCCLGDDTEGGSRLLLSMAPLTQPSAHH